MSHNQLAAPLQILKCKAIDTTGCLGSLYDNKTNSVIKRSREDSVQSSSTLVKSAHCTVTHGSTSIDFSLLELSGIHDAMRLNILLGASKRIGIAAVINYSGIIDEQTRILCYSYIDRREEVVSMAQVSKMLQSADPQRVATHVITAIDFGIDLIIIIRLPLDRDIVVKVDNILRNVRCFLQSDCNSSMKTFEDKDISFLDKNSIVVCSNTPSFTWFTSISQTLDHIAGYKNSISCRPVNYYLHETKQLCHQYQNLRNNVSPTLVRDIERCLLQLRTPIHYLEAFLNDHKSKSFFGFAADLLYKIRGQLGSMKTRYKEQKKRISQILTNSRDGEYDVSSITSVLYDHDMSTLKTSLNQLAQQFHDLGHPKSSILQSQQQQSFQPNNQSERRPSTNNSAPISETTQRYHHQHGDNVRVNYTGNNEADSERINSSRRPSNDIRHNFNPLSTPDNHIYPVKQLEKMMSSNQDKFDGSLTGSKTPTAFDISESPVLPPLSPPTTSETINILLLGETGVGKSTFINAFVNYLSFDTFEQAELNKPVVLIPVSFLMTVGENFEERTVKFGGDMDKTKNEDFDHPGQSVTQHCKSYVFDLDDGKKLCIIDTPGFGDTRGIEQDDRNMQNILEYINNLSHLNAICFLLKPNSSRLNIFFRSCLMQIFDLLGTNICKYLTFCFTNSRSTFYSPGDTGPLLKSMLKSLTIGDIPFTKENAFCFDSESFRYLVALRDDIPFAEEDKQEYAMSWSISVKESNRLIDYVRTKLVLYPQKSDWQSPRHAQFEIMYMIRPMLEAMRNNLRNTILRRPGSSNKQIVFKPRILHHPAFLCYKCKEESIPIERFRIAKECPHEIQDERHFAEFSCTPDQHIRIYHLIEYESVNVSTHKDDGQNALIEASSIFAYFLVHIVHSVQEDPFDAGLKRMIVQENDLCDYHIPDSPNSQLIRELKQLQQEYENQKRSLESKKGSIPLTDIYHWMNRVRQLQMIKLQMDAISHGREILMKQHEKEHQEI